ncbi:MAG: cytochrome c [Bosea sp. (in: a-proteobacteria)]|nr:cytochrome c [Bosea sp. (in: a-proteobacteria)]
MRGDRSGARLAQDTCLQCHGTGVGPDLRLQELSYETIRYVARSGLNAMPSFRETEISDGELREVADYLASLRIPAGQTPGPVPGALQSQDKH